LIMAAGHSRQTKSRDEDNSIKMKKMTKKKKKERRDKGGTYCAIPTHSAHHVD